MADGRGGSETDVYRRTLTNSVFAAKLGELSALQDGGEAFHALADTMPQMVWSTLPDGQSDYYSARWYEFTGTTPGSNFGDGWAELFHPDDQPEAWKRWQHSLETGEPYEVEYRLRHHNGEYRWVLGRGLPVLNEKGEILRWIGTCTDIHEAKETAERNKILNQELSHRIKNIFAVISGLIGMTARSRPDFKPAARELQDRIAALGRAHEFVRPHSKDSRPDMIAVTLHAMLGEIFASYPAYTDGRLTITGDDLDISDRGATPIALVFHELATNAMKYGALSIDTGKVGIAIILDDDFVRFHWRESGGPAVATERGKDGFGSKLTRLAVCQQLGGDFDPVWKTQGLEMSISAMRSRIEA